MLVIKFVRQDFPHFKPRNFSGLSAKHLSKFAAIFFKKSDDDTNQMERDAPDQEHDEGCDDPTTPCDLQTEKRKVPPVLPLVARPRQHPTAKSARVDSEQEVWHRPDRRNSITSPSSEMEKQMNAEAQVPEKLSKKEEKKKHKEEKKARKLLKKEEARLKKEEAKLRKKEKHKKGKSKGNNSEDSSDFGEHEYQKMALRPGEFRASVSLDDEDGQVNLEAIPKMSRYDGVVEEPPESQPISKGFASDSDQVCCTGSSLPWRPDSDAEFSMGERRRSVFVETSDLNGPEGPIQNASTLLQPTNVFPSTIVE